MSATQKTFKRPFAAPMISTSFDARYQIDKTYADRLSVIAGFSSKDSSDNPNSMVIAIYDSATAFSGVTSNYANLPKGSIIIDLQASKIFVKTAVEGTATFLYWTATG